MTFLNITQVVIGAGIGGGMRYVFGDWIAQRSTAAFPWHTFAINVSGAFLLGVLMALPAESEFVSPSARLFLGVGILGGFTTFSALSYESIVLVEKGMWAQGLVNMLGSAVVGLAAVTAGLLLGRAL